MHSYLFIGNDTTLRIRAMDTQLEERTISPFDQVRPREPEGSIGIAEIRLFLRALSLSPQQSPSVAGVIEHADHLTLEAQAALLKTLEEPPPQAYILLGASIIDALLPTIVSRCTIVRVADTVFEDKTMPINLESSPGKLLAQLSRLGKTKEDYATVFDRLIHALEPHRHAALLHRLLRVRQYLFNNVHPLTLLEHILLDKANPIRYNKI